jgi:superfamily II DNA or RNA helicase
MAENPTDDRKFRGLDGGAVLPPLPSGAGIGDVVAIRGQRWRLVASTAHADCRELHLHAIDGTRRVLLWPFERIAARGVRQHIQIVSVSRWTEGARRWLGAARQPLTPRAVFSGDLLPYQLAPAVAMAAGATRLLLADEVGLGKTIQAGWILADLLAREPQARALVALPASLRDQWASELAGFFALSAARVDAAWLRAAIGDRPADVSPWAAPGAYLASIDFLKRPDVARSLSDVTWDLLVVDEAHAATAPTERHAALARIAAVSRRIVVITATPYSGDAASFASMVALGATAGAAPPLMFRRSRDEVGDRRKRRHRFVTVRIGRAEHRLQRLLERYTRDVWRDAPGDLERARLAMTILRKRALSSPAAALRSLSRRLELLRGAPPVAHQLSLFEDPTEPDDALPEAAMATPGLTDAGLEARWLTALVDAARRAMTADSKQRFLLRLLGRVEGEAVIVFTEYRDTLRRLAEVIPEALELHGGLSSGDRTSVQRRFNETGGVLLATDAAADGLNLQRRCRLLVNYELPWNPARLEQRIGRIDRIGQRRIVHAVSLVARDTAEDLVVAALTRRLARVAATLGDRDRLATFLTDARTARSVIAGGAIDPPDESAAVPALPRPLPEAYPVDAVVAQLRARGHGGKESSIAVTCMRASGAVPPGCVAIVRVLAVTDGNIVAERPIAVLIRDSRMTGPDTRGNARALAARAVATSERGAGSLPEIRAWFADVAATHAAAVGARLARERALLRGATSDRERQPGLFDRRSPDEAVRAAETRRTLEHDRRIASLTAALNLRLECSTAAVLIAWR